MKKLIVILIAMMWSGVGLNAEESPLYYQGEVVTIEQGGAYSYLEIKEKTEKTFWVAVNKAEVKIGDYVRFKKELVAQKFESKALQRTFDELMFASHLEHRIIP